MADLRLYRFRHAAEAARRAGCRNIPPSDAEADRWMFVVQGCLAASVAKGSPVQLKKFNATVRMFDPSKGLASGQDYILPVNNPDEEHAASSTMVNAVAFTIKTQGSSVLPVAFCCMRVEEQA